MIARIQDGDNAVYQVNTDLLVNKVAAEDYKQILSAVQNDVPLSKPQKELLVQANVLTPVREVDLSMPDINLPGKAVVQDEEVPSPSILQPKIIVESAPGFVPSPQKVLYADAREQPSAGVQSKGEIVTKAVKKVGMLDKLTNYIYSIFFK